MPRVVVVWRGESHKPGLSLDAGGAWIGRAASWTPAIAARRLVAGRPISGVEALLRAGAKGRTPRQRLRHMAETYRRFATEHPNRYAVIYSRNAADDPELAAACAQAAQPLFEQLRAAGVPERRLLPLARTLTAFLHGFVSMEIVNAFRLGGNLDRDFAESLETILGTL